MSVSFKAPTFWERITTGQAAKRNVFLAVSSVIGLWCMYKITSAAGEEAKITSRYAQHKADLLAGGDPYRIYRERAAEAAAKKG